MSDQSSGEQHREGGIVSCQECAAVQKLGLITCTKHRDRLKWWQRLRIWWLWFLFDKADQWDAWRERRRRFIWKCYRDGGGGVLETPRPMTKEKALAWLQKMANAEIFYVDANYHFLFYRSRL